MSAPKKLVPSPQGHGFLHRDGRRPGSKSAISRAFEEFSQAVLEDPMVQRAIRQRLMDELAGRKWKPMPCLTVLAAAAVRQKPPMQGADSARAVVFLAEIISGRGVVRRVELGQEPETGLLAAAPAEATSAEPSAETAAAALVVEIVKD